ncbi:MAG: cation:proton antiporter [Chitinispirillaceae bacterium]|nr:cation:proton antiporter [Chitinispirillaceae bacterium]
MHYLNESHIFLFLLQLFIIILLARTMGELFKRWKQPALTAELFIGILLGPTVFGRLFPGAFSWLFPADAVQQGMLETAAWIGVLFLLLDTGLEIDFSSAWRQRGNALIIALTDIIVPMAVAFVPVFFLPGSYLADPAKRILFSLFMAVVMTISAMPVSSRIMHDLNILKTDLGFLTMSALTVNDIAGWALFTIILGLFLQGSFSGVAVLTVMASTIGFSALALTAGRTASGAAINRFKKLGLPEPGTSFTFACLLGLLFGAFTQKIGIHALFGFFIAGIVVGEAKNLREETRTVISQMVHSLFVPVFFVNIGLKIDFAAHFDLRLVALVTLIGVAGRYAGAWAGVSLAKVPRVNKTLISIAHTPGGMMEIVVALLALESGLILPNVFIAVVCSAVFSSILTGPWMRWALNRRKDVAVLHYLTAEGGTLMLSTADKSEAIGMMAAGIARLVRKGDAAAMSAELLKREEEFSTAVGKGIAIPHLRTPAITDPVVMFGLSHSGIDWNAPDGKPVHFIFFMLSPSSANDLHVEILSKTVAVLQDRNYQARLLAASDNETLGKTVKAVFAGK